MGEGREIRATSAQAGRTGSLGDRPIVVLTAGVSMAMPGISEQGNRGLRQTWLVLQRELAGLSRNSDHRIIEGAGHYIQRERPGAVILAVRDVVAAVRERRPVRREAIATN